MSVDSSTKAEVRIFPNVGALNRAAADEFIGAAREAVSTRSRFAVALSGGSTPQGIYALLSADHKANPAKVPWDKIHVFFGDERPVPPTHADSNFLQARQNLLAQVPLPQGNLHRVRAELGARSAAADYEHWLRAFFHARNGQMPKFDLIMLGMGTDGHTASLFPNSAALNERTRLVCENWVQSLGNHRVTFTYPLLNAAAEVMFVVSGRDKAQTLRHVLNGDPTGATYPAKAVQPASGKLLWLVDEAAASLLD